MAKPAASHCGYAHPINPVRPSALMMIAVFALIRSSFTLLRILAFERVD
jgi:hypothetical protein